ncbi:hypothetical protein [Parapedobacter lycopersici]|uniref:hypothetical protein n=1 Tax=Parapedobacter lycopersici TaxID=1864939 RepID=UPI00214DD866|nr:hypothetical protein [Parapedobacter lycopersici]
MKGVFSVGRGRYVGFVLVIITILLSCKKTSSLSPDTDIPDTTITGTPPKEDPTPTDPVGSDPSILYFEASGNRQLVIDGSKFKYDCETSIRIKAGNYSSITIRNINAGAGCPISISNDGGNVVLAGTRSALTLANLDGVVITGDIKGGDNKGFIFKDNDYRAIILQDAISNLTLSNMSFSNVKDYVIFYDNRLNYTGQQGSYSDNLKIQKMDCVGTGQFIQFNGGINGGSLVGVYKNLEISYINYRDSPRGGNIFYINNALDYDIHHNVIDNVNTDNNNHNGIFHVIGNGKFHNNFVSNHQGNSIRAWAVSIGNTPKDILIYNNIVVNSRKYSAFEVQAFSNMMVGGQTTYANVKVFNNTCGNLNLSRDAFPAAVVDIYGLLGGQCEVFNNLGYNFPVRSPKSDIWHPLGNTKIIGSDNLYFNSLDQAGLVAESFKLNNGSPAKGSGMATLVDNDFYGIHRDGNSPSIGAVE